jgi:hypothetical protein
MLMLKPKLTKVPWLLPTLIGLGIVNGGVAQAQSALFLFQNNIGTNCKLINVMGGSLALSSDQRSFNTINSGNAKIVCNTNATVTVDAPQQLLGPTLNLSAANSTVQINGTSCRPGNSPWWSAASKNESFTETIAVSLSNSPFTLNNLKTNCDNIDVKVDMNITSTNQIPAGSYGFRVRVTVTP